MSLLTATFEIPSWIAEGLASGNYERVGGVIREVANKRVVAWLRDGGAVLGNGGIPSIDPITGTFKLISVGVKAAVMHKGFISVNEQLDKIQTTLAITSSASLLSLGVSVAGFAMINKRLDYIEQELSSANQKLDDINEKLDLDFYATFRAGLSQAINACTMSSPENRRESALSAIGEFLKAEIVYEKYVDREIDRKSNLVDQLLTTLALAYLAEARCHLELDEPKNALQRLEVGCSIIREKTESYIKILLTKSPAAYLDSKFRGTITLRRLTKIYQWLGMYQDENAVFEALRWDLLRWFSEKRQCRWAETLPLAIVNRGKVKGSIWGNQKEVARQALSMLPKIMNLMESMVETNQRLEGYQSEISGMIELDISFQEWSNLYPVEGEHEQDSPMLIIPKTRDLSELANFPKRAIASESSF